MILIIMYYKARGLLLIAVAGTLLLGGCSTTSGSRTSGSGESGGAGVHVAAAFYPLEFAVRSVAGDLVDVTPLTIPGVEAHDVELTPRQVAATVDSDLVVYLSGFQPAVDEAVKQIDPAKVLDVAPFADLIYTDEHDHEEGDEHDHGDFDPHFWLDPLRLAAVTDAIAERLAEIDPDQAATFRANTDTSRAELSVLDEELTDGLRTCVRRELFTSHAAFEYMASRYDLTQVSVVGIAPNVEPSGSRIAEVQKLARRYDATTIFFETTASDAVAKSIAQDLGLQTAVLDPIESIDAQSTAEDYPSIMRANLAAIQKANDCG
ncbi:MAG: metal ABC transporter substrate-binding protein [Propionibacteriaceae bacterium]|nr:metal ABC transporter substrate-binding protein [Propionibacteriaceae bacterium]